MYFRLMSQSKYATNNVTFFSPYPSTPSRVLNSEVTQPVASFCHYFNFNE